MYISNRTKLIIAGILVLIAVILILIFLPGRRTPTPSPAANTNQQTNTQTPATPVIPRPTPTVTPEERAEASAETMAKVFAERYGSYSTESEAANLEDVIPLATPSFAAELQAQINRLQASAAATEYYGVSTRILNTTAESIDVLLGTATYTVLTQREEARGSVSNTSVSYQTLTLTMQKEGDNWLVDRAVWE